MSLDGQRLILANGTLVLRSVKAEDSGYYTCTATNTLGFDTIIVNLLVQGRENNISNGSGSNAFQAVSFSPLDDDSPHLETGCSC